MIFRVLVPISNESVLFQIKAVQDRKLKFIIEVLTFAITTKDFRSKLCFGLIQCINGKFEVLDEEHHGVEFINSSDEHFNGLLHIMSAIEDGVINFFLGQFAVNIKGNGRFLDVVSHETFKGFQTPVSSQHHIIVYQWNAFEQAAELPSGVTLHNDVIIDFLWVKTTKNAFQDVLVIVS